MTPADFIIALFYRIDNQIAALYSCPTSFIRAVRHGVLGLRYFATLSMTRSGGRSPRLGVMLSVAQRSRSISPCFQVISDGYIPKGVVDTGPCGRAFWSV